MHRPGRATKVERDANTFPRRKSKGMSNTPNTDEMKPASTEAALQSRIEALEATIEKMKPTAAEVAEAVVEPAADTVPTEATEASEAAEVVKEAEAVEVVAEPLEATVEAAAKEAAPIAASAETVAEEVVVAAEEEPVPVGETFEATVEENVDMDAGKDIDVAETVQEVGAPLVEAVEAVIDAEVDVEVAAPTAGAVEEAEGEGENAAEADGEDEAEEGEDGEETETMESNDGKELRALFLRVTKLEEKISESAGPLALAEAAIKAATSVAVAAAQQNTRAELVATETARSLGAKMEETFQQIATSTVETHADLIGTRLNSQLEERLNLARETVSSLGVLKGEMKSIGKSLQAEVASEQATLPSHSIFNTK